MANRVSTIDFLRDDQLTFFVGRKPYPTRTKESCTLLLEFLFESIERTKLIVAGISERYIELYEHITGEKFNREENADLAARIEKNVSEYLAK